MMQMKCNVIAIIAYFTACLPQLHSVPAAFAVVAGGCDWPLPSAVGLSNNDVIALRPIRQFRYVPYVALDGNTALVCGFVSLGRCDIKWIAVYNVARCQHN